MLSLFDWLTIGILGIALVIAGLVLLIGWWQQPPRRAT
jgi:hypothetical protein